MAYIAGKELHEIIDAGIITGLHENVNACSIDLRLGDEIKVEIPPEMGDKPGIVDLTAKEWQNFETIKLSEEGFVVQPGQFFLAHTVEEYNLPDDISSEFVLRSSIARSGLNHMLAGFGEAGFNNAQLTLEFHNCNQYHSLLIKPGMRIGQVKLFRHADAGDLSYAKVGSYNNQRGATAAFSNGEHADVMSGSRLGETDNA